MHDVHAKTVRNLLLLDNMLSRRFFRLVRTLPEPYLDSTGLPLVLGTTRMSAYLHSSDHHFHALSP